MSNFSYLATKPEYSLFASAAIEAEKVFATSPAMCAVGCRKALELAVKWVYAADKTITMPYKDNLQSLLHEESFRFAVDKDVWSVLPSIVKAGNLAVHTGHSVSAADAVFSLRGLFDFIQWVDYCYGTDYVERSFDETAIPGEKVELDTRKIREQESLLTQKDAELEALRKQVESLSAAYTASKQQNQQSRSFTAADLTEAETRRKIIDIDLKAMGWKFTGADADVRVEYEVDNMNGVLGQKGYAARMASRWRSSRPSAAPRTPTSGASRRSSMRTAWNRNSAAARCCSPPTATPPISGTKQAARSGR